MFLGLLPDRDKALLCKTIKCKHDTGGYVCFFSRLNALLVNGNWSEWVDGPCSKTCSLGVMKRTRTCSNPEPFCGGSPCLGVDEVDAECLVVECDRELNIHIV